MKHALYIISFFAFLSSMCWAQKPVVTTGGDPGEGDPPPPGPPPHPRLLLTASDIPAFVGRIDESGFAATSITTGVKNNLEKKIDS